MIFIESERFALNILVFYATCKIYIESNHFHCIRMICIESIPFLKNLFDLHWVNMICVWHRYVVYGIDKISIESTRLSLKSKRSVAESIGFLWNQKDLNSKVSLKSTRCYWNPQDFHGIYKMFMESQWFS